MVVITGVQGSGRTYLAKSLVNDLQNDGKIEEGILICSLNDLVWGPWEKIDMYNIDDIFYELQLYDSFKETLETLNVFLSNTGLAHLIITIPSYTSLLWIWRQVWSNACRSKWEEREKLIIVHSIKAQYDFTNEQSEKLIELQNNYLVTSSKCIAFPALVLWICKQ